MWWPKIRKANWVVYCDVKPGAACWSSMIEPICTYQLERLQSGYTSHGIWMFAFLCHRMTHIAWLEFNHSFLPLLAPRINKLLDWGLWRPSQRSDKDDKDDKDFQIVFHILTCFDHIRPMISCKTCWYCWWILSFNLICGALQPCSIVFVFLSFSLDALGVWRCVSAELPWWGHAAMSPRRIALHVPIIDAAIAGR